MSATVTEKLKSESTVIHQHLCIFLHVFRAHLHVDGCSEIKAEPDVLAAHSSPRFRENSSSVKLRIYKMLQFMEQSRHNFWSKTEKSARLCCCLLSCCSHSRRRDVDGEQNKGGAALLLTFLSNHFTCKSRVRAQPSPWRRTRVCVCISLWGQHAVSFSVRVGLWVGSGVSRESIIVPTQIWKRDLCVKSQTCEVIWWCRFKITGWTLCEDLPTLTAFVKQLLLLLRVTHASAPLGERLLWVFTWQTWCCSLSVRFVRHHCEQLLLSDSFSSAGQVSF